MQQPLSKARGLCLMTAFVAVTLAGCSKDYLVGRDTIALSAGDAMASDSVAQMVDPWPAYSADTRISFNGQKMQSAVERYRNNQVIPPKGTATAAAYPQGVAASAAANPGTSAPVGPSVTQSTK